MEERLRSILRPTRWSLLSKTALFAVTWLVLPGWVFALIALYLYLAPWFQPWRLMIPFGLLLVLALTTPASIWLAILLGVAFYLVIGVKDLVFVNRHEPYQILMTILVLLYSLRYAFPLEGESSLWWPFGLAIIVIALLWRLERIIRSAATQAEGQTTLRGILGPLLGVLVWQSGVLIGMAPLPPLYQAALMVLTIACLLEFLFQYVRGSLSQQSLRVQVPLFLGLFVVVLATAPWGLS